MLHPQHTYLLSMFQSALGQICGDQPQTCEVVTSSAVGLIEANQGLIAQLKLTHKLWQEPSDDSEQEEPTFDDVKNDLSENV
jgi:hypothetical protein